MRVIAGALKGRRLAAPKWTGLRPTSDKLRETLFNLIAGRVAGVSVLDAYAGTGALGIEALSRGAAWVTFIDRDARATALIRENLERCGVTTGYAIIRAAVTDPGGRDRQPPKGAPFDLILADPPYDAPDLARAIEPLTRWLAGGGLLVIEHPARRPVPERIDRVTRVRVVKSGDSALSLFEPVRM